MSPVKAATRLLVCVLAASLVATPAFAQPARPSPAPAAAPVVPVVRRPVAVVNLDLTGNAELLELANALYRVLETHPDLRPRDVATLYERIEDPDARTLDEARSRQRDADAELVNGNFPLAAKYAKEGQDKLLGVWPTQASQLYAELAFLRGKVLLDSDTKQAQEEFVLTQRLNPQYPIDKRREPPDLVQAFERAKAAVPMGKIEITNKGTVWIDGFEVGFAPNQYVVAAGPHVVWVTNVDRLTNGIPVDVKAGPTAVTPVTVPEISAPDSLKQQRARVELVRAPDDGARLTRMKRVAELALGVKDAVVISIVDGKIIYQTWRSDDADRAPGFSPKHEKGPKDLPAKLIEDLLPPKVEKDDPGVVFPIPHDTTRWYQKPSYWAGIAFGTSLVAVGAYYLITSLLPTSVQGPQDFVNPNPGLAR